MSCAVVRSYSRIPDKLWARLQPLLPTYPPQPKGGRPRADLRSTLDGIFYVLRTGCQWKELPVYYGSSSTTHRYFQEWVERGIFARLWAVCLREYDARRGIAWKWQSLDCTATKAPLGGEKNR